MSLMSKRTPLFTGLHAYGPDKDIQINRWQIASYDLSYCKVMVHETSCCEGAGIFN